VDAPATCWLGAFSAAHIFSQITCVLQVRTVIPTVAINSTSGLRSRRSIRGVSQVGTRVDVEVEGCRTLEGRANARARYRNIGFDAAELIVARAVIVVALTQRGGLVEQHPLRVVSLTVALRIGFRAKLKADMLMVLSIAPSQPRFTARMCEGSREAATTPCPRTDKN
jgi:hypothetical protein